MCPGGATCLHTSLHLFFTDSTNSRLIQILEEAPLHLFLFFTDSTNSRLIQILEEAPLHLFLFFTDSTNSRLIQTLEEAFIILHLFCFFSDSTNSRLIQTLEEAYKQMKHLPSPPVYTSICQMLALQYMELSPLKAAFYLAESIAVTFRHQSLINAARKIR
jgi:hypothetical protein